jgi:hypothetical protein
VVVSWPSPFAIAAETYSIVVPAGLSKHEQSKSSLLVRELLGLVPFLYLLLYFVLAVVFAEVVVDKEVEYDSFFVVHHT